MKNSIVNNLFKLWVLLQQLLLVLALFTLCRLIFYAFNLQYYTDMSMLRFANIMRGGLLFDVSALMFINALYIVLFLLPFHFAQKRIYTKVLKYLFLISNSVGIVANMGDVFYFDFTLKRSTADVLLLAGESNMLELLPVFIIDFWYGFLAGTLLIASLIFFYNKIKIKKLRIEHQWTHYLFGTFVLLFAGFMSVMGMRGSFVVKTFPITLGDAGKYTEKVLDMALVMNTPFTILKTLEKQALPEKEYFSPEVLSEIYSPIHTAKPSGDFKDLNLVVLILESFSREYISSLNPDLQPKDTYTPFLDSLIRKAKVFPRAFANGRQSISALPAICAGIPSVVQPFVTSAYASNELTALGSLLADKNYHTSFFHGAENGSLGLGAFMNLAGYQHYFGRREYDNDAHYDGTWGIRDEDFFQFFAERLDEFSQPFHSVFFSLSSHHPYSLPEHYADSFPSLADPKIRAFRYADNALRTFFSLAQNSDWYENTLFVITADHGTQSGNKRYATSAGAYAVPIIFYQPCDTLSIGYDSTVVQHIDILPTVMNYLNYDNSYFAFGKDMFDESEDFGAVNYLNETWQYIKNDYLIQFRSDTVSAVYNYKKDYLLQNNLLNLKSDTHRTMERELKAFIQEHNTRMIHNRLILE